MNRICALFFLFYVIVHPCALAQRVFADKILFNGKIYTADQKQNFVEAVAIWEDRIVAVGSLSFIKRTVDSRAEMIDLKGKVLLPGLIDSHNHAISGGESLMDAYLNDELLNRDELGAFAGKVLESRKGMRGDVLFIDGAHSGTWAHVDDLHSLFNNPPYLTQPVVMRGSDGHTAWVNKPMLQRAGVHAEYLKSLSNEERKYFGFSKDFEPNGLISEDGFATISKVLPASKTDIYDAAILGVKHLNGLGITAWMDPAAGSVSEGESNATLSTYKRMSAEKKLTAHVVTTVVADANKEAEPQIILVKKLQDQFSSVKNVSVAGFKIFADGVLEYPTQTAAISIPYKNSGSYGSLMVEPARFKQFVTAADWEKLLVHVHAIGDRAVTESLNSFETARKANGNISIPHSITHLQVVKPSDFKRFSSLNVMASMQLLWATADSYTIELVKPYIDSTLFAFQYPALSLLKTGTVICGASDWPVSSANPFEAIYVAETRLGKLGVLDAGQIMPRIEMMKAYTINAARSMLQDKNIGSIEVGKQADFVLVDRDVFSIPAEELKQTKVIWTMFGGQFVFQQ